jgi:hypothetical protein
MVFKNFYVFTVISHGTPNDVAQNPRVLWNAGWETLFYTFIQEITRLNLS